MSYPRARAFGESKVENWKIKELERDLQCVVKDSQGKKKGETIILVPQVFKMSNISHFTNCL